MGGARGETHNDTWLNLQRVFGEGMLERDPQQLFEWVKYRSHVSRGVTIGTMLKDEAFFFIRLGTFLERADNAARIIDVKFHDSGESTELLPAGRGNGVGHRQRDFYYWAAVLRSVSAFESYRKVYRDVITPVRLAELLILRDDTRSLHFCMRQTADTLELVKNDRSGECLRQAGRILSQLRYGRIQDIFDEGLHEYLTKYLDAMPDLSREVQRAFFAPTLAE